MKIELLPEGGHWYKVNFHCHTDISDGKHTPEEIKESYKAKGYHAVCYTDHEVLIGHKELCDENFVALHGYEIAIKQNPFTPTGLFMPVYHMNLVAKSQDKLTMPRCYRNNPSYPGKALQWMEKYGQYEETIDAVHYDSAWISEYLRAVRESGFLPLYNHPQWSLQNYGDFIGIEGLHGIEVINGACSYLNDCTSIHYEQMLRAGKRIMPVAGDDNHGDKDRFIAWTMLKAPSLTYDNLITALERGHGYATNGPEIHSLVLEDGVIRLRCSEAVCVTLFSQGRYMLSHHETGKTYTEVCFPYHPDRCGDYFRFEVRDKDGHCAYSNAYYIKDIENSVN